MKTKIVLGVIAAGVSLFLSGCNGSLSGASASSDQVEVVTAARAFRVYEGFATTVLSTIQGGVNATLTYDGNLYYTKSALTSAGTVVSYYVDSGAADPVGTATITTVSTSSTLNVYSVTMAVTNAYSSSTRPETGTLTVSVVPSTGQISTNGVLTLNSASGALALTLNVTAASGTLSGNITTTGGVSGAGVGLQITSGTISNGTISLAGTGTILSASNTFTMTLGTQSPNVGAGTVTLTDGAVLNFQASGAGSLSLPGVSGTINIVNVDDGE